MFKNYLGNSAEFPKRLSLFAIFSPTLQIIHEHVVSNLTETLKMKISGKSIRTFIGSKNYNISRNFYMDLGFEEIITSEKMSYFYIGEFGFYLQDAYVKDWVDNSMVFFEVDNLESTLKTIQSLKLTEKYENVRLSKIVHNVWGNEFFLHDPSGILWHFGKFKSNEQ